MNVTWRTIIITENRYYIFIWHSSHSLAQKWPSGETRRNHSEFLKKKSYSILCTPASLSSHHVTLARTAAVRPASLSFTQRSDLDALEVRPFLLGAVVGRAGLRGRRVPLQSCHFRSRRFLGTETPHGGVGLHSAVLHVVVHAPASIRREGGLRRQVRGTAGGLECAVRNVHPGGREVGQVHGDARLVCLRVGRRRRDLPVALVGRQQPEHLSARRSFS